MSEWLDVMLEEIARKQRESEAAKAEQQRRAEQQQPATPPVNQSK